MSKQRSALCSVFAVVLTTTALADTGSDYRRAQRYMTSHAFSQTLNTSVLHANTTLPPAPAHPAQQTYYNHPESIHKAAASHVASAHTVGNLVQHSALTRPKMQVNPNSPEVQFSKKIETNADAIATGTYKDCHKKVMNDVTYTDKTCRTPLPFQLDCINTLTVTMQDTEVPAQKTLNLANTLRISGAAQARVITPVPTGFVTGLSLHLHNSQNPWNCLTTYALAMNGVRIGSYRGTCHDLFRLSDLDFSVRGIRIPFIHKSVTLMLIGGGLSGLASGTMSIDYRAKHKTPVKTWVSSCATRPASCHVDRARCLEPSATKDIDGIPVSAPCWQTDEHNQCGAPMSESCCALEREGCTQSASRCDREEGERCTDYQETWSCPNKQSIGTGLQCGQRFYCMDGSCQGTTHDKNKDAGKSITELSALASAAEDVKRQGADPTSDPNNLTIFAGRAAHCREVVLGALNCCADRGWAKGIFVNCNAEEKALGHAKEQGGLVVALGRYCSAKVLGVCTEHKKGYCIFPSRIADDVQVGGRQAQLGRGFGEPKTPDCSGLSPSDMGRLDFDRIDFSNAIHGEMNKAQVPSGSQSQHRIEEQMKQRLAKESPHG